MTSQTSFENQINLNKKNKKNLQFDKRELMGLPKGKLKTQLFFCLFYFVLKGIRIAYFWYGQFFPVY